MDIKIEAPGHKRQELLRDHYEDRLNAKYGVYEFVKAIDVKIKSFEQDSVSVSLLLKPEKGVSIFAEGVDEKEHRALNQAIHKMNVQIEKYKEKHYHNVHRASKKMDHQ